VITAPFLIQHLFQTCRQISNNKIKENDVNFKINEFIENFLDQVKHCINFALQGQTPYTAEKKLAHRQTIVLTKSCV